MVWDMEEARATVISSAPCICKVIFQNISLVLYKSLITIVTMGKVKINRCWRIPFVLFIIACCYNVSGVFSAAHDLKMEWVVVKGISGYADGTESKENWQTFASVTAASLVVSILKECSIFEDWPHYKGKQINFYLFWPVV